MGISMSEAKIEHDTRDTLLSSNVAGGGFSQGKIVGISGGTPVFAPSGIAGANLAGITPEFATAVTAAIDGYAAKVTAALAKLEAVSSSAAFQGTGVTTALQNFITGVKEVGNSYITGLQNAENQIMNSVHTVYTTQDSDLQGQMQSDTSNLEDQKVTTSGTGA